MDRPLLRLVLLALCLLLMGSSFVKCTTGDQGLHFVGGSTGDGSDGGDNNSAPTAESFTLQVAPNTPTSDTLRATDPDGDALTYSIVNAPTLGTVELNDASTGRFTYTTGTQSGIDSFSYEASDGSLVSGVATVTIEIGMGSGMASLARPSDRGIGLCAAAPVSIAGLAARAPAAPRAPAC